MKRPRLLSLFGILLTTSCGCAIWQPVGEGLVGQDRASATHGQDTNTELLSTDGGPTPLLKMARQFETTGQLERAEQMYRIVLERAPDNSEASAAVSRLRTRQQRELRTRQQRDLQTSRRAAPGSTGQRLPATTHPPKTGSSPNTRRHAAAVIPRKAATLRVVATQPSPPSSGLATPRSATPPSHSRAKSPNTSGPDTSRPANVSVVEVIGTTEDAAGQRAAMVRFSDGRIVTLRVGDDVPVADNGTWSNSRVMQIDPNNGIRIDTATKEKVWYR